MTAVSPGTDGVPVTTESRDEVVVRRWPQTVPTTNTPAHVAALKKRLAAHPRLTLDAAAIEVVAGLFVDTPRIRHLADSQDGYDRLPKVKSSQADLSLLEGDVDFGRLVPLINPRLGHRKDNRLPPMHGAVDEHGQPLAQTTMHFDSVEQAEDVASTTAWHTLSEKNADYSESILTHEIMTPIEVVLVRVTFGDGTPAVVIPSPYDGISRTVSAAKVAHGAVLLGDEFPTSARRKEEFETRVKASFRSRVLLEPAKAVRQFRSAVKTFNADLAQEQPNLSMRLLRWSRSLTVPIRLIVGGEFTGSGQIMHQALPSAIATLQASRHISVNPWDEPAQDAMAAHRMVSSLANQGLVTDTVARLVDDQAGAADAATLFRGNVQHVLDERGHIAPLWRAVGLIHALTRASAFEAAKGFIRTELGLRRVDRDRYAAILGVLIDEPWRAAKHETLTSARHAWRNYGVLADDVWNNWTPVTADSATLTRRADNGDDDARITMLVAAGTALIADGVLTRDTGSKVDDGRTDYRSSPHRVLARLAESGNWHGLRQAGAIVASFRADAQGSDGTRTRDYTYPRLDTEGHWIPDGTGQLALAEGDVYRIADPAWARQSAEKRAQKREDRNHQRRTQQSTTPEERNRQHRDALFDALSTASAAATQLRDQQPLFPNTLDEHPVGDHSTWQKLDQLATTIGKAITQSEPPQQHHHTGAESTDDPDNVENGEDDAVISLR